ncbi:MAG TPA: hypothetical protein VFR41_07625 [Acidimicrobiia bacterium]|nr:hypothetical protein [Acidimicrobiia bacterium]
MLALDAPPLVDTAAAVDPELIERRIRHRRILQNIPGWIVKELAEPVIAGATPMRAHPERAAMETHLRDVADRLAGQLRMTLEELTTATTAMAAQQFYATAGDHGLEFLRVDHERATDEPMAAKYGIPRADFRSVPDIDHEALAALVAATAWADELAGDYRDPRINA